MRTLATLFLLLACGAAAAGEPKLPELDLRYAISWKGMTLGEASITLKPEGGADCYRYESISNPIGLVRMFYGKPRETSDFCVRHGAIVAKHFEFKNPKDDSESFTLEFAPGKVRDGNGKEREVPVNVQDRFGMQQAVRLWVLEHLKDEPGKETVEYTMADDHRIKSYRFAITGRETVEVPAGRFDAIVVQRIGSKTRSSKFWLGATRDYMPVKVEQFHNGAVELRMVLRN